jgi:hypothetical protein
VHALAVQKHLARGLAGEDELKRIVDLGYEDDERQMTTTAPWIEERPC